jgi:hypothetical protein
MGKICGLGQAQSLSLPIHEHDRDFNTSRRWTTREYCLSQQLSVSRTLGIDSQHKNKVPAQAEPLGQIRAESMQGRAAQPPQRRNANQALAMRFDDSLTGR